MKPFNCIVVDDDEVDCLMIVSFVKRYEQLCLAGIFESAEEALSKTDFSEIDVVFLDIDMDGMDGISFRKMIQDVPACIFITAHPEYALDSFSVDTLDFVVKPISFQRFDESILRLQTFLSIRQKAHLYENMIGTDHVFIREGHKETKVAMQDVLYLEGLKDYTLLVTEDKKHCVLCSIGNLLKELHFNHFVRVHRSFAVRKDLIKSVSAKEVLLTNDTNIPIGRSFKDNIKSLLLTMLFLISFNSLYAQKQGQDRIDSLLVELGEANVDTAKVLLRNELFVAYRSISNLNLAHQHAQEALTISEATVYQEGIAASHNNIAVVYALRGDFDKAVAHFTSALKMRKKMGDHLQAAKLSMNIGMTQGQRGKYPDALRNILFAKNIFEKHGDAFLVANAYLNMGNIYYFTQEYSKAEENFLKSIDYFKKTENRRALAGAYANLAPVYSDLKDYNKALDYYQKSYTIADSLNHISLKALVVDNMGLIYEHQNNYDKALQNYNMSLALIESNGDQIRTGLTYFKLGRLYNKLNQPEQAIGYLDKSLETAKRAEDIKNIRENYESLAEAYSLMGNHEAALENYKLYTKYKDSIFNEENTKELTRLEVQYEADKKQDSLRFTAEQEQLALQKEMQLAALHHEYERKQAEAKNEEERRQLMVEEELKRQQIENEHIIAQTESKRRETEMLADQQKKEAEAKVKIEREKGIRNVSLAGLALIAGIGGLLFYQSRSRKKHNKKLHILNTELKQANLIKTRFFSILNHDLRSPVANLIHFLHLQNENPELLDKETKERLQGKTISGAENLLASMEDLLLWSKGQMENFKPEPKQIQIQQLFEDNKKVFSGYQNIHFAYHNPDDLEIFTDLNYLKTIVRNLTSNAINVFTTTENPSIIWQARQENGRVLLSVTDNGPGADSKKFRALYDDKEVVGIKSGLGLHLIRDLAKAIGCTIEVESTNSAGTTIKLLF